jgi:hexokinase
MTDGPPNDPDATVDLAAPPLRPSAAGDVVLAIDIGGTKMAVGLVTLQGELIDRDKVDVLARRREAGEVARRGDE